MRLFGPMLRSTTTTFEVEGRGVQFGSGQGVLVDGRQRPDDSPAVARL